MPAAPQQSYPHAAADLSTGEMSKLTHSHAMPSSEWLPERRDMWNSAVDGRKHACTGCTRPEPRVSTASRCPASASAQHCGNQAAETARFDPACFKHDARRSRHRGCRCLSAPDQHVTICLVTHSGIMQRQTHISGRARRSSGSPKAGVAGPVVHQHIHNTQAVSWSTQCSSNCYICTHPQVQRLVEVAVADAGVHQRRHLQDLRQRALRACPPKDICFNLHWLSLCVLEEAPAHQPAACGSSRYCAGACLHGQRAKRCHPTCSCLQRAFMASSDAADMLQAACRNLNP